MTKTGKPNYEEFKRLILEIIPRRLPKEYQDAEVVEKKIYKVNQILDSFTLIRYVDGERTTGGPIFYIDELFDMFQDGASMQKLISHITDALQRTEVLKVINSDELDFDEVKGKITMELINHEKNEELLKQLVHSDFLDLAFIYRIEFPMTEDGAASIMITNEILDAWEVEPKDLHRIAYMNMKTTHPATLVSMINPAEDTEEITTTPEMYILSNGTSLFGSTALIFNSILQRIAKDIFNGDFYIIPSSLHEVLLIRHDFDRKDELKEIIKDVNRMVGEPKDFLSDSLYYYDAELDEVKIA